jgi:hypothetical protein
MCVYERSVASPVFGQFLFLPLVQFHRFTTILTTGPFHCLLTVIWLAASSGRERRVIAAWGLDDSLEAPNIVLIYFNKMDVDRQMLM